MQDTIYNSEIGLHYKLMGDYHIPLVKAPDPPQIGKKSGVTAAEIILRAGVD